MSLPAESQPSYDPSGIPGDPTSYRRRGGGVKGWVIWSLLAVWSIALVVGTLYVAIGRGAGHSEGGAPLSLPFVSHPAEPTPAPQVAAAPEPAVTEPAPAPAAITERLDLLERQQRKANQAAASALAAASLAEAAQSAAPFDAELASIGPLLPSTADLPALQRLARQGAPTRTALAVEFTKTVTRAASAAHAPAEGAGWLRRFTAALSSIVTVRRVDNLTGFGADAILARAQRELDDGDLEAAVADLDKLPPGGKKALASWRERAQRRIDIDKQVGAVRSAAMRDLSASAGGRS
jgi:hypothetical protein